MDLIITSEHNLERKRGVIMREKKIHIEILQILGCTALLLRGTVFLIPGANISFRPDIPEMVVNISVSNMIGPLAFPIFAFLLVEGFHRIENFWKYAMGVLLLAVAFEIPSDLVHFWTPLYVYMNNMFFTFFFSIIALKLVTENWNIIGKIGGITVLAIISSALKCEYGICGMLMVMLFEVTRKLPGKWLYQLFGMLVLAWLTKWMALRGYITAMVGGYIPLCGKLLESQYFYVLSLIPISLCSGQCMKKKYFPIALYALLPVGYLIMYWIFYQINF